MAGHRQPGLEAEGRAQRRRARRVPRAGVVRAVRAQRRAPAHRRGHQLRGRWRPHRLPRLVDAAPGGHQRARLDARCDQLPRHGAGVAPRRAGVVPAEPRRTERRARRLEACRSFVNPDPDVPPEINVSVDRAAVRGHGPGRRHAPDGVRLRRHRHRRGAWCNCSWRPTTELPAARASDWIELWVRGGELLVNGERAHANCFVVIEPGATFTCVRRSAPTPWPGPRAARRGPATARRPVRVLVARSALPRRRARSASIGGRAYRPGARGPAR